jgi:hypothetical protein
MYPSGRVLTHPFRVLGLLARGSLQTLVGLWRYHGWTAVWCAPLCYCVDVTRITQKVLDIPAHHRNLSNLVRVLLESFCTSEVFSNMYDGI